MSELNSSIDKNPFPSFLNFMILNHSFIIECFISFITASSIWKAASKRFLDKRSFLFIVAAKNSYVEEYENVILKLFLKILPM